MPLIRPEKILPLQLRVDLRVIKSYSTLPRTLEPEYQHQIRFIILHSFERGLIPPRTVFNQHIPSPTQHVAYIYIYIYIYVIHRQTCFVLSELFTVARHARFPKLGSKPDWLKRQSKILPLSHEETNTSKWNLNAYVSHLFFVNIYPLNGYRELDIYIYIYIYIGKEVAPSPKSRCSSYT